MCGGASSISQPSSAAYKTLPLESMRTARPVSPIAMRDRSPKSTDTSTVPRNTPITRPRAASRTGTPMFIAYESADSSYSTWPM